LERNSRRITLTYRLLTALVMAECVAGGIMDLARQGAYYSAIIHLGYPPYFTYMLGTAKLLAAAALLAPGLPRLKEWAYAGILFNMIGAAISYVAVGGGIGDIAPPAVVGLIALLSWLLRQQQAQRKQPVSQ
jgi:uncharacterized membrane protein YphA (DoxX/SURF4 family)